MKKNLIWIAFIAAGAGVWAWYDMSTKPANKELQSGVKKIIQKHPSLKSEYDIAMKDSVLTTNEARAIIKKVESLKDK